MDQDPDPHGSETFAWIRIRNSENSKLDLDPNPEQNHSGSATLLFWTIFTLHIYRLNVMFDTIIRLFLFACLKDAAGARAVLKNVTPAPSSDQQKIRLRLQSCPISEGSRRLRLCNTVWIRIRFWRNRFPIFKAPDPGSGLKTQNNYINLNFTKTNSK